MTINQKDKVIDKFKMGEVIVHPQLNLLVINEEEITIEPQAMATLVYLAQHKGDAISLETLLAQLWQGKVVTDNALHRVIRQLRKALNDSATHPKYIKTITKKGYSLIADIEELPQPDTESINNALIITDSKTKKQFKILFATSCTLILLFLIGVLSFTAYFSSEAIKPPPHIQDVKQVTSLPGFEEFISPLPNQQAVLFTYQELGKNHNNLYVKKLSDNQYYALTKDDMWYDEIAISPSGNFVLFTFHHIEGCQLKIAELLPNTDNFLSLGTQTTLNDCFYNTKLTPVWSSDSSNVYYLHYDSKTNRQDIRKYQLKTNTNETIYQTKVSSEYLHSLSIHHKNNQLAWIESNKKQQKVQIFNLSDDNSERNASTLVNFADQGLFELDWFPEKNGLLLRKKDGLFYLNESGDYIHVHPDESRINYANHIFITANNTVMFNRSNNRVQVHEVALMKDQTSSKSAKNSALDINSSGSEFMGKYSYDGKWRSYYSNREHEKSRLWLSHQGKSWPLDLTNLSSTRFYDWAPDQLSILYISADERITRYDVDTQATTFLSKPLPDIGRAVWSHDPEILYFSQYLHEKMQLFRLTISNGEIKQLTSEGANYLYESANSQYLYFNKATSQGLWRIELATGEITLHLPLFHTLNRHLWQLTPEGIYSHRNQSGKQGLFLTDLVTGNEIELLNNKNIYHFDVSPNGQSVLITNEKSIQGDIYQAELFFPH